MKKAIVSIIAVMFFIFPVMVNAAEADVFSDILDRGQGELQEAFKNDGEIIQTAILEDISGYEQLNYDDDTMFGGVLISLADYAPSVSFSVLSSNLKITGVDIILVSTLLVGSVTLALISRKKAVKAN